MSEARALAHRGLAWLAIALAFVGWVLMLSGVASLQQACSSGMVTTLSDLRSLAAQGRRRLLQQNPIAVVGGIPGTVGYLAPVQCNKFFSYAWWITFFNMVLLLLLAGGVTNLIGRLRGGMIALSAVLLVLLMDTTNTFLYFNHIQGLTGMVRSRARVLVAGSIISAIAYFFIIGIVGWHDEEAALKPQYDAEAAGKKEPRKKPGGSLLGGLFKKKKEAVSEEEGAGTPGSPRMVHVPRPPLVPQPVGAGSPGAAPVRVGTATDATNITATTIAVPMTATTAAVPVSMQAAPISTNSR